LPKLAFSKPPQVGPMRAARCSVAWPISRASGITPIAASVKVAAGSHAASWAKRCDRRAAAIAGYPSRFVGRIRCRMPDSPVARQRGPAADARDMVENRGRIQILRGPMDILDLKKHLVDVCHRASERWLTSGSGGNISVRVPNTNRYLCTATGVTFRD